MEKQELIYNILERGTEDIVGKEELRKKLKSDETLRVKLGLDPTGTDIHLGGASQFWRLNFFQQLGHKVIFIIGDFTAKIGDASDKKEMRKGLSDEEKKENMRDYKNQIDKILDLEKVEIRYNSEWYEDFELDDFIRLAKDFTAQQMIRRRNFKERWEEDKPIGLHEILYPLLQGYDSVMVEADVEIGGFDQLFNLKTGRKIQKLHNQDPQKIITSEMLYGLDGREMSTSWGNVVNVNDNPKKMYGKLMSLEDDLIMDYFNLCAFYSRDELEKVKKRLKEENPKIIKKELAFSIVKMYHGEKKAEMAESNFEKVYEKKENPDEIPEKKFDQDEIGAMDLVYETGLVDSKSQAKRLIQQGAVKIDGEKVESWRDEIELENGMIIKIGKDRFMKVLR